MSDKNTFGRELEFIINQFSQENASNTPDFILATYLLRCLNAWNEGVTRREEWYGREHKVADTVTSEQLDGKD